MERINESTETNKTLREIEALVVSLKYQQWVTSLHFPWDERGTMDAMITGLSWHELEHTQTIQKWRKSR